ncbi:DEAD/DEAH box helicase family protein [Carboxylicivirga sp. A043]|uniref:DEAD/DEAH box helicase n=1 Tax=Carboxylicivirga litoralis TaxID=2816963 RepID=UPI0021CB2E74|nr:DEAD/DEAH box helicase [Carboxylicivirga sp. A043]MCU4157716.1 DEAD/DEAH box helicase family protein [Carboxylicivirga sp. A043]
MAESVKDYISGEIDFYASNDVSSAGTNLYKEGKVSLQLYQKALDNWIFSVKDTKMHKVQIRNLNNRQIETMCNCSYIGGRFCSHTIAALLFVADIDGNIQMGFDKRNEQSSQRAVSGRSVLGFELPSFENITESFVKENTTYSILSAVSYSYQVSYISELILQDNSLIVQLEQNFKKHLRLIFKYVDDKMYITPEEKTNLQSLTEPEVICLLKIARSASPDLLKRVFKNSLEGLKAETLTKHGIESGEFSTYFSIGFDEKAGLVAKQTEFAKGLMPIEDDENSLVEQILHEIDVETFHLETQEEVLKQEREMGFILELSTTKTYFSDNYVIELTPIIGKPNKTREALSSHISEYDGMHEDYLLNISEHQNELLELIDECNAQVKPSDLFITHKRIMELLAQEKHVYVNNSNNYKLRKADLEPIVIAPEAIDGFFEVKEDDTFIYLNPKLKIGDRVCSAEDIDIEQSGQFIYVVDGVYYVTKDYRVAKLIVEHDEPIKMVKSHKQQFFYKVIKPLANSFDMEFDKGIYPLETAELDFKKKQVFLSEREQHLLISPQVEYHHGVSVKLTTNGNVLIEEDGKIIQYKRNFELEDDFAEQLSALHPKFEAQKSSKVFHLHYNEFNHDMWFYKFFDALQLNNVEVYGLNDLKSFKYSPHKGKISTSISSGQDWFDIKINVSFGDNVVKLADIRKAVLKKQRYIQLSDGSVGVLPAEWFHRFEKYFRHGEVNGESLSVSKLRFSIVDELFDNIDDATVLAELAEKRRKLAAFTHIEETAVPASITADLRHYQKEGLNWLNFLHEMGWGGILADDMGLGKTLQVLTFLQHVLERNSQTNLIIVPTTLLFNWENEIRKFAPSLKAYYHYGVQRVDTVHTFDDYDIVFTTYGILLRDIEMLKEYAFNYIVLDESQAIKNPASRRYKAASLLKANSRLALSGTPIENSTFDLYAQMSFVNRGFLGGVSAFKDSFSNAIDKEGDELIGGELQRLINPFVLRRTKEKVAKELPPKTEDVIFCEMDTAQRKVYDAYRNQFRDQLIGKVEEEGIGKSKMMVLEALTRLRQICDSPQLIGGSIDETESVKIKEIIQHITDKTANHKILIFSQFVKMLGLIKDELSRRGIEFEYLDGKSSTKQREQSVNNFQTDDELRVFLISLKAGGTGLNLTAADYVYIVDPWWNPAVENQAIDRCYRIGQDKNVFAYRMICRDTVEEKILKLQERKKKVAGDIVQTDESIMKNLTMDDIKDLLG